MKDYLVTIKQISEGCVNVKANSREEAEAIVFNQFVTNGEELPEMDYIHPLEIVAEIELEL